VSRPQRVAHDLRDGLHLDLLDLSASDHVVTVEERVGELVDERLDTPRRRAVRANRDPLL
jgi:hypothetical protein